MIMEFFSRFLPNSGDFQSEKLKKKVKFGTILSRRLTGSEPVVKTMFCLLLIQFIISVLQMVKTFSMNSLKPILIIFQQAVVMVCVLLARLV